MESVFKLKDIYKALYDFERQYINMNNITINEAIVLHTLKDGKPLSAKTIYHHVGLSKSRMSRVLSDIEEKGYVVRKTGEKDKRNMLFSLSFAGGEKLKEITGQKINFSKLIEKISTLAE